MFHRWFDYALSGSEKNSVSVRRVSRKTVDYLILGAKLLFFLTVLAYSLPNVLDLCLTF